MSTDFSLPQRQSVVGIWVLFFYSLQRYGRAFWPIILIYAFRFNEVNKIYLVLSLVAVFTAIGIISYLKYLNFTFALDSENKEFIINEGIINKTKTAIQLNKIQQVNINQSFIQRLIGVYELNVDTAGSNKKEGAIKAISHKLALELKSRLLDNDLKSSYINSELISEDDSTAESVDVLQPFLKISFLSLLKVGITSNYGRSIALLLLFFSTIYENFLKFGDDDDVYKEKFGDYIDQNLVLQSILLFIFWLIFIVLIVNIFRTIYKYYNYVIVRQNGSLLLSFGLISTKSTILKPEKVQIVVSSRNFFQKKMEILELKIKQATSGEKEQSSSAIEIPGCSEAEGNEILNLLYQKIPTKGLMLKPNWRKLIFSIFLTIGLPLFAFIAIGSYIDSSIFDYAFLAPIYVICIGLIQYFKFVNNRLFINKDFIIKQSGAWDVKKEIIKPSKIQAVSTSQLFWHKKLNIGSVILHTAGGDIAFQLGDYIVLKQYINKWLYEIETSDSNWM
ncbi:putative membrane protein [Flavobacterium micromati]|uniref:Putative membrane protein n=1 Tax=Flavobacterium micromati TaxID=229205 RepID=A0A1M5I0C2_9FLAO|nr:PH domain-containing protein [Flavobacterium micromati]SHG21500.1 putative membrane protein [Flavobacterium micromati]